MGFNLREFYFFGKHPITTPEESSRNVIELKKNSKANNNKPDKKALACNYAEHTKQEK